jgi:hypothetical protein
MDRAAVSSNLGAAAPQKSIKRAQAFEFTLAGVRSLVWGSKQNTAKNRDRGMVMTLDGHHSIEGHNNQLENSGGGGGGIGEEARLGKNLWGVAKPSFRPSN